MYSSVESVVVEVFLLLHKLSFEKLKNSSRVFLGHTFFMFLQHFQMNHLVANENILLLKMDSKGCYSI